MSASVSIRLELPKDWARFKLPRALDRRLTELLDKQDLEGKLTAQEKKEAKALVELSDWLSLMKLRARFGPRSQKR
jgi:hypothetical protein